MQDTNINLTDLMGLAHLQHLQDNFSNLTGINTMLVDSDGYPITRPSFKEDYLQLLMQTEGGLKQILLLCRNLCVMNRKNKKSVEFTEEKIGVQTGAVPIFLDKKHLGSWIVSRINVTKENQSYLASFLTEFGVEQMAATNVVEAMANSVSRYTFEEIFPFLEALTHTVIQLAQVNYDILQSNQNLMELTEQLDSTAQMLAKFTNSADVGMYVTDFFTGEILQANERFGNFVNRPVEELIGSRCWKWHDSEQETFCSGCPHDKLLDEKGHPGKPIIWERYLPRLGIWAQFTNQAIYWVDGRLAHMVTFADITQTKQMQEQLANLAYYDRVMRLPNSLKLLSDMQNWSPSEEYHLICFDIVMLRTINDVYSRQTGDTLLTEIARWVQRLQISDSQLYRVDGDEFVLLVKNQGRPFAQKTAEKIRNRFEEPWIFTISEQKIHIFCNITTGVIHIDNPQETDGEELLSLIERTLSTARETGKTAVYDEAMDEAYKEHLKLELSLRRCVKEGMLGFQVFYQPIVDPVAGTWCSLEALCRWNSPECGEVPPLIFIHEAEQMGLIGTLGRWVLETAVRQCKEWGLDELDNFLLDVNLSPAQMTDETLVSSVIEILDRYDYPGDKLSLEITESTEMNFSQHTLNAIERLRRVDVQVALDDFGTGYSSFNNLKQIPVGILKTERAFLQNIENDSYLQYLFHVMVELAHAADMKIIAEGVESEEQMRILLKNGVDYLQGYLFSPPLSAEDLEQKLENFIKVSNVFYNIRDDRIDVQKLLDSGYTITPALYRTLNHCMQILLSPMEIGEAVYQALKLVGEKFNISRASVYWRNEETSLDKIYEWCDDGIKGSQKNAAQRINLAGFEKTWLPLLKEKGLILSMDIHQLPEEIFKNLNRLGSRAVAIMPVWKETVLQGLVSFEDCKNYRDWLPEEVLMLHNLSLLMGNIIERQVLQDRLMQHSQVMDHVLNSMDLLLFVSDTESKEILFANQRAKEAFGSVEGRKCWEVVQQRSGPCSFCNELEQSQPSGHYREEYSQVTDRFYRIYDQVIPWKENSKAHLEYAVDITATKQYQDELKRCAELDTFTGTLNRTALLSHMSEALNQAHQSHKEALVCFIDIGQLKFVNENYGQAQGDAMVLSIVKSICGIMEENDIIGRYGGDEFVMMLHHEHKEQVALKIREVRTALEKQKQDIPVSYSFSYGVVQLSELVLFAGDDLLQRLLETAESRMLEDKEKRRATLFSI